MVNIVLVSYTCSHVNHIFSSTNTAVDWFVVLYFAVLMDWSDDLMNRDSDITSVQEM